MTSMQVSPQRTRVVCVACGAQVPSYESVSLGSIELGYRQLCSRCFNSEMAVIQGLKNFENFHLEPITLEDVDGVRHEFHFRTHLLGGMLSLEAFEVRDGAPAGYQFQSLSDPQSEILSSLARLIDRMRRGLAVKYLERGALGLQIADEAVRGRIESDEDAGDDMPCVVIDGQKVSWEEFGRIMLTYEGWQFRMELIDRSEEL